MRIVFFTYWGTIGDRVLEWLLDQDLGQGPDQGEDVLAVVTRPGQHGESTKELAFQRYVPLLQPPENVNDPAFGDVLRKLRPDLFISMYFGRLFAPEVLAIPKQGCINMHNSLLPKYRGQGPTTWALIHGDQVTGQTIHYLDEGIDTGDIIAQKSIPIDPEDTGTTLGEKVETLGVELFKETWPQIKAGTAPRIPQDHSQATYFVAPRREHARIDWTKTSMQIHNGVRAFARPALGAYGHINGQRLYVWETTIPPSVEPFQDAQPGEILAVTGDGLLVQTGDGQIVLNDTEVGREGPDLLSYLAGAGKWKVVLG